MSHVKRCLGIDPGLKGAFALLAVDGVQLARMPTYDDLQARGGKGKTFIDADKVTEIIRGFAPDLIVIEDVFSGAWGYDKDGKPRKQGAVSAFSFGEGKGILKGVCAALGYSTSLGNLLFAHASVWKPSLGVTSDKKTSKAKAYRLFPLAPIKSADEAEAALIAVYGLIVTGKKLKDVYALSAGPDHPMAAPTTTP